MATMRARSGGWNVYWLRGGRGGKTESLTFALADEDKAKMAKKFAEGFPKHDVDSAIIFAMVHGKTPAETEALAVKTPVPVAPTVAELAPLYLKSKLSAEARTTRKYRQQLDLVVLPEIGNLAVTEVTADHISAVIAKLKTCDCVGVVRGPICSRRRKGRKEETINGHVGGLDRRTIDRYYNVMKGLFGHAVNAGLRPDNPVKAIDWKPQTLAKYNTGRQEDNHVYLSKAEFSILRSCFEKDDHPLIDFLVQTGARISEATALKVRAIKRSGPQGWQVQITDAWKEDANGNPLVGTPKAGSNRTIGVRVELIESLSRSLEGKRPTALVFTSVGGGQLGYDEFRTRWDRATLAAVRCPEHLPVPRGVPTPTRELNGRRCGDNGGLRDNGRPCGQWVTPGYNRCADHVGPAKDAESACSCWDRRIPRRPTIHDLRHTHVAWLIDANRPLLEVARRLGHASSQVTEKVYAGLLNNAEEGLLEALKL